MRCYHRQLSISTAQPSLPVSGEPCTEPILRDDTQPLKEKPPEDGPLSLCRGLVG
jgi:hypothetical protein